MTHDEKLSKLPIIHELIQRAQDKLSPPSGIPPYWTNLTPALYPETVEVDTQLAESGFAYISKIRDICNNILATQSTP